MRPERLLALAALASLAAARPTAAAARGAAAPILASRTVGKRVLWTVGRATLEKPLYLITTLSAGLGAKGLQTGQPVADDAAVVRLVRSGERMLLVRTATLMHTRDPAPTTGTATLWQDHVLASASIIATGADGAVSFDAAPWLDGALLRRDEWAAADQLAELAKAAPEPGRSRLVRIDADARRVMIREDAAFRFGGAVKAGPISASVVVTIGFAVSLSRVPARPMVPRLIDDRVNFATTDTKAFGSAPPFGHAQRAILRWRLREPGPDGAPPRPLTFYIDSSVPSAYRAVVAEAVLAWNTPLAAAGMGRPLRVLPLPAGADPYDPAYPTIQWTASDTRDYVGYTVNVHDPRTGEMVRSGILLDGDLLRRFSENYAALGGAFTFDPDSREVVAPPDILAQAVRWMALHEMGHALGLQHNFRASAGTPAAWLDDSGAIAAHGTVASVMDYPGLNVGAAGDRFVFTPRLGDDDMTSILFGYASDERMAAEAARRAGAQPGGYTDYRDTLDDNSEDPFGSPWDLTDDPLGWAERRAALLIGLLAHPPAREVLPGDMRVRLAEWRSDQLDMLLKVAVKYVGGYSIRHLGREMATSAVPSLAPVEQRAELVALKFLLRYGLLAEQGAPALLIAASGARDTVAPWSRAMEPATDPLVLVTTHVSNTRRATLTALFDQGRLTRMNSRDDIAATGQLTLAELFDRVGDAVWTTLGNVDDLDLRVAWIDQMVELSARCGAASSRARVLVWHTLTRSIGFLDSGRYRTPDASKDFLLHRIGRAIDAGRQNPCRTAPRGP